MNADPNARHGTRGNGSSCSAPAPRFAGHFAGIMLDAARSTSPTRSISFPGPCCLRRNGQSRRHRVAPGRACAAIGRGLEAWCGSHEALRRMQNGVMVNAREESFAGRWLIGCDGGRSTVRKIAGFEFAGTEPEFTGYTASVEDRRSGKAAPRLQSNGNRACTSTAPGRTASAWLDV